MKQQKLTGIICLLVVLLLVSACGDTGSYHNALPKDAALVISADLSTMVDKSGLNNEDGKTALDRLSNALKSGMEGTDELIDQIVENPEESGLELTDRIFFFSEPQLGRLGLLVKVSKKGKVKELMKTLQQQHICEESRETDGCIWTVMGKVLVAYNSQAFLALAEPSSTDAKSMQHAAAMLLRQGGADGFSASDDFRQMQQEQGDIVVYTSMDLLPSDVLAPFTMGVSAEMKQKDVKYISTVKFLQGKAIVDIRSHTTDAIMKECHRKRLEAMAPIKGKYLDFFPANTLCWVSGNVDGSRIYSLLCENPVVRQEFENAMMPIDFESVFSSIKGDMALAFTDWSGEHFIAYADVTNAEFLQEFEGLKPLLALTGGRMQLVNHGTNAYEFRMSNSFSRAFSSIWLGVKGDHFYITNDQGLIDARVPGLTLRDNPWGQRVPGNYFFFALNANVVHHTFSNVMKKANVTAQFLSILAGMDYMTIESSDGINAHIELVQKNKDKNFLQSIWQN